MKEFKITENYVLYTVGGGGYAVDYTEGYPHISVSIDSDFYDEDVTKFNVTADIKAYGKFTAEDLEVIVEVQKALKKIENKVNRKYNNYVKKYEL